MKICFLSDINSAHTQKWITYFNSRGHDVHVISLNDGTYSGAKVYSLNINKSVANRKATLGKLEYLNKISKIKKILNEIKPDILNAHYASSYGLLGALTNFHPYVISVWGSDIFEFPNKSRIHKKIIKYNLKNADYIFSTGAIMKKEIEKYANKEIEITPFGIDIDLFDGNKKAHAGTIIGITKSLEEIYGIDLLIRAFAVINKKYNGLTLKIAGRGTLETELKTLCRELEIEDKVVFLGYLKIDQIKEFYSEVDIAVFPSRQESFGVAALEAQASRIPVITSDAHGFKETVVDGETGLIYRRNFPQDLIDKLSILIEDKDLRESMGNQGRRFVEDKFKLESNFRDIEKLFEKIIKTSKEEHV